MVLVAVGVLIGNSLSGGGRSAADPTADASVNPSETTEPSAEPSQTSEPEVTPTDIPTDIETTPEATEIEAPEMVPYFVTEEQMERLNNDSLSEQESVWGETLIPATQAYIDNLMASLDDMGSVDTSTIAASPDADIVIQLRDLVSEKSSDSNIRRYYVGGTRSVPFNEQFSQYFAPSSFPLPTDEYTMLAIVRTTFDNVWGSNEDNHIYVRSSSQPFITEDGQIVFK